MRVTAVIFLVVVALSVCLAEVASDPQASGAAAQQKQQQNNAHPEDVLKPAAVSGEEQEPEAELLDSSNEEEHDDEQDDQQLQDYYQTGHVDDDEDEDEEDGVDEERIEKDAEASDWQERAAHDAHIIEEKQLHELNEQEEEEGDTGFVDPEVAKHMVSLHMQEQIDEHNKNHDPMAEDEERDAINERGANHNEDSGVPMPMSPTEQEQAAAEQKVARSIHDADARDPVSVDVMKEAQAGGNADDIKAAAEGLPGGFQDVSEDASEDSEYETHVVEESAADAVDLNKDDVDVKILPSNTNNAPAASGSSYAPCKQFTATTKCAGGKSPNERNSALQCNSLDDCNAKCCA